MVDKIHCRIKRTYVGRRISVGQKLCHFWLDEGKKEEDGVRGHVKLDAPAKIGEIWEFTYGSPDAYYIRGEHAPVPRGWAPKADILRWEAKDSAVYREYELIKAKKRLQARSSELEGRIAPLSEMVATIHSRADAELFIDAVASELWKAYWEGRQKRG